MPDTTLFLAAAERAADRFRAMPQRKLSQQAPAGLELARSFARAAGAPTELPDVGVYVVGDQIALTAHDLAYELERRDDEDAERLLAEALESLRTLAP